MGQKDKSLASITARAIDILYCSLTVENFNKIWSCKNAKNIWHTPEVIHEDIIQVKECKINSRVHKYKLFRMYDNEIIFDMLTRFTKIGSGLKQRQEYSKCRISSTILW